MSRSTSGRNAVVIVRTPSGWNPASINSIPPEILETTFYARKLPLYKALAVAEAYNAARMAGSIEPGTWAMCVVAVGQRGSLNSIRRASMSGGLPARERDGLNGEEARRTT
jgi:hypothetical protein